MATEVTSRDRTWQAVLTALSQTDGDYIVKSDIDDIDADIGRMTRLRTLSAMTDLGVLQESDKHNRWHTGPKYDGITCNRGPVNN